MKGLPHLIVLLVLAALAPDPARAQAPTVQGDYVGTLGPITLKLHIVANEGSSLSCTLDSPNQGANGLKCSDVRIDGQSLSFRIPIVNGSWSGSIEDGGARLSGTWSQGQPLPLVFLRETFVPAREPSPVDGFWLGVAKPQGRELRTQLVVKSDIEGQLHCTVDSVDLNAFDIACSNPKYSERDFSFDVPVVKGHWTGKLSSNGDTLSGTWTQKNPDDSPGAPIALNFERQQVRLTATPLPPITFDDAIAPVSAARMQEVLRQDLQKPLREGILAPGKPIGVAIGVVTRGDRRIFTFGNAATESLFEIGSITKTFTGLLLAQMIESGSVRPDTAVRELLPQGAVAKPQGAEITLLDLATQHSGLPRMPGNFRPADSNDPYIDYGAKELYGFILGHGVAKPAAPTFLYSNLGFGLLGQALSNRAGIAYPELLHRAIVLPMGLTDTATALSPERRARLIQGHATDLVPAQGWDFDALAGAGAIRSTAADMLTYLEWNLHPRERSAGNAADPYARTLPAALDRSQQLQSDVAGATRIAYAWLYDTEAETYAHNGATGGYSSYAFFSPKHDYAAVVLVNMTIGSRGSFADRLGRHIQQRFAGKQAVSLDQW
ncbi:MAG TPA: serine hydrolase [Povalibacter sp.]|uniref:serine hydrolase domain-containing protein n=1 Tax=Povalibacter sp. TaxID=1962978 RepID=UPI002CFF4273|nr:serine hydrolase [Povalibacter sp.]HMN45651.1 serine hydrolase [Povalibacter sp.]